MKVEGYENIERDDRSKAILSSDLNALLLHKKNRERNHKLETEINIMKDEISEIKSLLKELVYGSSSSIRN